MPYKGPNLASQVRRILGVFNRKLEGVGGKLLHSILVFYEILRNEPYDKVYDKVE